MIVLAILHNVNQQIPAYEEALYKRLEQEHQFAEIVQSAVDAIIQIDLNGQIQAWNENAALLFGYSGEFIRNRSFAMLLGNDAAASVENQWLLESTQHEGFLKQYETRCRDASGHLFHVDLTSSLIYDDDHKAYGISIILRDISQRKHRETEIEQQYSKLTAQANQHAQQLSEKIAQLAEANNELKQLDQTRSEFVSLVSHQIRAPLTNMAGAVQRMQSSCAVATPTCHRMFGIFEQQVNRLDRLVQDVLNLSRIEQGDAFLHQEPMSVLPVVRQAIQQVETRISTHAIHLVEKPGLPLVYADRDRIVEVLTNLLDNAHKYTPDDKSIFVDIRADQSEVTVSVRDTGKGLPEADVEKIFEKFYRVDSSDSQSSYGYGLGLYLCRRLLELQGGHIWAENHPSGGAVFSFSLPVWEE